jgi:hypothetical protein
MLDPALLTVTAETNLTPHLALTTVQVQLTDPPAARELLDRVQAGAAQRKESARLAALQPLRERDDVKKYAELLVVRADVADRLAGAQAAAAEAHRQAEAAGPADAFPLREAADQAVSEARRLQSWLDELTASISQARHRLLPTVQASIRSADADLQRGLADERSAALETVTQALAERIENLAACDMGLALVFGQDDHGRAALYLDALVPAPAAPASATPTPAAPIPAANEGTPDAPDGTMGPSAVAPSPVADGFAGMYEQGVQAAARDDERMRKVLADETGRSARETTDLFDRQQEAAGVTRPSRVRRPAG